MKTSTKPAGPVASSWNPAVTGAVKMAANTNAADAAVEVAEATAAGVVAELGSAAEILCCKCSQY